MTSLKIKSLLSGLLLALAMVFSAPAMADALDDARAAGLVGERPDGLVAPVSPSAPANVLSLVQSVNAQRMEKYQQIANQKGVPVEQIGAIAGEKIIAKLKPGFYYMDSSGTWVTK
ncbi:MAG TPA: YdbL family protein [Dongiaceae bacterium]|nr:YdbL family protein [Dongiaceae bacterium]